MDGFFLFIINVATYAGIGALAGFLAFLFLRLRFGGRVGTIGVGAVGGLVGGFTMQLLAWLVGQIGPWIAAIVGSLALIFFGNQLVRRGKPFWRR